MGLGIAIVGYSGLFPGSENPEEFFDHILKGKTLTSTVTSEDFGMQVKEGLSAGLIRNFIFDSKGFELEKEFMKSLDPVYQWTMHCCREALIHGKYWKKKTALKRCGLIAGNLSFPTRSSRKETGKLYTGIVKEILNELLGSDHATDANLEEDFIKENIFSSEQLAALSGKAIGTSGPAFSIDAACASSLYAIKLAADYLLSGKADMMLAGAVSCADPLYVNMGFDTFAATPSNGKISAPLDKNSGGLAQAEGAGMVLLKRLEDARADGDTIYGVIESIGLSNDGKGKFLLSPNQKGQELALSRAYKNGTDPSRVSYIECHATGMSLGDATELKSIEAIFDHLNVKPAIGSVKANIGHMITAAGMAGLVKLLEGLKNGVLAPSINIENPLPYSGKIIQEKTELKTLPGDLLAINAFGFGGTNAHLVLSGNVNNETSKKTSPKVQTGSSEMIVTGMECFFGPVENKEELLKAIISGDSVANTFSEKRWKGLEEMNTVKNNPGVRESFAKGAFINKFDIDAFRYKILPNEAERLHPQQTLMLAVADKALKDAGIVPGTNVSVIIALNTDLSIHEYLLQQDMGLQVEELLKNNSHLDAGQKERLKSLVQEFIYSSKPGEQTASLNTGLIGNLVACRISSLWDLNGPAFTVSGGANSFSRVLELASMMLKNGETEAVLAGAIDLAGGFEHMYFRGADQNNGGFTGEGAAAFVLKSRSGEEQETNGVYAVVETVNFDKNDQTANYNGGRETFGEKGLNTKSVSNIIGQTYTAAGAASFAKAVLLLNHENKLEYKLSGLSANGSRAEILLKKSSNKRKLQEGVEQSSAKYTQVVPGGSRIHDSLLTEANRQPFLVTQPSRSKQAVPAFSFEDALSKKMPIIRQNANNVIWDEKDLLEFAEGKISHVFGEKYAYIDNYTRRVRLPAPPYLLVNRVTALSAKTGEFKPSTIQTEYDIPYGAWYSVDGQAPWAVAVESGQCDLLLISYLGIDFENKGNKVYRLLDSTITFLDDAPMEGSTLRYDISINSFTKTDTSLLFFFSYECFCADKMILRMDGGCAGFFSDQELSLGQGVVRSKMELAIRDKVEKKRFVAIKNCDKQSFEKSDLLYLSEGKPEKCFGAAFNLQWRNPSLRLPAGEMLMVDRVSSVNISGGIWGLGLITAEKDLSDDAWYFISHFKDDQVLAGSLQAEGGAQLLQFYMLFLGMAGLTQDARFQPVPGLKQKVRCRKQVVPGNKKLRYRMEVKEIKLFPYPQVISDVEIITDDGLVAVHFENLGMQIKEKSEAHLEVNRPVYAEVEVLLDEEKLQEFALGSLEKSFGKDFAPLEKIKISRLPNTWLKMVSRVMNVNGTRGVFKGNPSITTEYDVPISPWYYTQNASPTCPLSLLMEMGLQPCGILSNYLGSSMIYPGKDIFFRNLDGEMTCYKNRDIRGTTLTGKAVLTSSSAFNGNVIQQFTYSLLCGDEVLLEGSTSFGLFSPEALKSSAGFDSGAKAVAWDINQNAVSEHIDLNKQRELFSAKNGKPHFRLSERQLNFIDEVRIVNDGGLYNKGYIYAAKINDPADWFYTSHFYQDPVIPGSLGVEAMIQALQAFCIKNDFGAKFTSPHFEQEENHQFSWKYRGQILPSTRLMWLEVHIKEIKENEGKMSIVADANLFKEELRIYEVKNLCLVIKES